MIQKKAQAGQVGLIVLLVMVVVVTVGVSVASRSVSELKISRQEQESTRSLNFAEAGIEDLLGNDDAALEGFANNPASIPTYTFSPSEVLTYNRTVTKESELKDVPVFQGHVLDVVLTSGTDTATGDLEVTWTGNDTAVVVALISNTEIKRYVIVQGVVAGLTNYPGAIPVSGDLARIKVLVGNPDTLLLNVDTTNNDLPGQYYQVTSAAQMEDGTTRSVQVNKLASLPSIFDYVLFSGGNLEQL